VKRVCRSTIRHYAGRLSLNGEERGLVEKVAWQLGRHTGYLAYYGSLIDSIPPSAAYDWCRLPACPLAVRKLESSCRSTGLRSGKGRGSADLTAKKCLSMLVFSEETFPTCGGVSKTEYLIGCCQAVLPVISSHRMHRRVCRTTPRTLAAVPPDPPRCPR
jgi:hypothetical protein